jgi:DNA primase
MRTPDTFKDDLRRQADIVRIIQDYVPLKKKGSNWMACCPFHQEKTPSFSVNPRKEVFYCFGCAKGGDVFRFVMEIENVPFPDAMRIVASKTGVAMPAQVAGPRADERRSEIDDVIKLNTWAMEWWEAQFEKENPAGAAAREYVARRGISEETRKGFRLGYSPDSWDALTTHLKNQGATQKQIENSGLVVMKEEGGSYDRFRGRLMFPVLDLQGRPIAFGARILGPGEPKYLNSPETAAYVKGRNLYGLFQNKGEIRQSKFAILMEGYLDLLIAYQFGVRNAVASLGTALTADQAKLLGRFARKVVVNYDGDRAGVNAAKRAIEVLLFEDFDTKVLVLPDNLDPDDFIRTRGVEEYKSLRGRAYPHIQFILDQAVRERNLLRPADKAAAVEEVLPYVRAVRNPVQQRDYFDIAMDGLRVEETSLRRELWRSLRAGGRSGGDRARDGDASEKVFRSVSAKPTVAEQQLLELLIHDEGIRQAVLPHLEEADFDALPTAAIFAALIDLDAEGQAIDFANLKERTADDPVVDDLLPLLMISEPPGTEAELGDVHLTQANNCMRTLRQMAFDRRIAELGHEMSAAERTGETAELNRLTEEHLELTRRKNALGTLRF